MLQICLIGAGRIGQVHAQAMQKIDDVRIKYVVDVFEKSARELASLHQAQVVDLDTAFSDPEIDVFIIASSTDTHAELLMRCCAANKAVFCEKPIDLNLKQAIGCAEAIETSGIVCGLGFNRRFDPRFNRLHERLQNGDLGALETLIITSRDPAPPPANYIPLSGGLFRDMMIHDFDMARWLLDEEIIEIYATGSNLVDPAIGQAGDIDTATATLKTVSGKLAIISNSRRSSYGYDQRVEAFGSQGMLQVQNQSDTDLIFSNDQGIVHEKPQYFFLDRYQHAYRLELITFFESLKDKTINFPDQSDGVAALQLAEAANLSLAKGCSIRLSDV